MSAHYRDFPNCRSSTICTTLSLHYSDLIARRLISSAVTTVVCSGLETHLYVSSLSRFPELQVIYDMHNVESPLFRSDRPETDFLSGHDGRVQRTGDASLCQLIIEISRIAGHLRYAQR